MATLLFHVVPNAKIDKVVGEFATANLSHGGHGSAIKIKLQAPAREGKANAALRRFLAQQLHIAEREVVLERGRKSRDKVVRFDGLTEQAIRQRLLN